MREERCHERREPVRCGAMKRAVTSSDVAKRVGVSQAAVSYAFSERADKRALISEGTRARILDAAQEMGYLPNLNAQSVSTGRTGLVALWVPNFTNSAYLRTMRGMQEVAGLHGLEMLIYGGTRDDGMAGVLRSIGQRRVEGAIMIARPLDAAAEAVLKHLETPLVTVGGSLEYDGVDRVLTRDADAFERMVTFLVERGYERIGFIGGPDDAPSAVERLSGFKRGLERAGLALHKSLVRAGTYKAGSAGPLALEMMRRGKPPQALVVANDLMAIEAILALTDHGYRVPGDVAVVGCDDVPEAEVVRPRLTTIRRPGARAAQAAMGLLLERVNGFSGAARTVWLEAELVVRDSA
jgi:LacI family transcriptional regulator